MPERRIRKSPPWLCASVLAALLVLNACDDGPDHNGDAADAPATGPAPEGVDNRGEQPASVSPSADKPLETRFETLRRRADNCSGDDRARVAADLELYEGHPELNQLVRRRLILQLAGSGEDAGTPPATLEEAADRFLSTAMEVPGDGARGWELTGETHQLSRWKSLVTVAVDSYEFTGGAHGMPVTQWLNWDLATNRPVSLGDVIRPGQEDAFETAARQAHQRWLENKADSDQDFREAWPYQQSSDFRFTRKGVVLHYDVYTIAPYVMGQPTLTVPWKDLNGVIRDRYLPAA